MSRSIPAVCAVLAVFLCAATGFTQQSLFGTVLEDAFYGFFFESYPLFLFAVVYGAARIVAEAAAKSGRGRFWRVGTVIPAMALFLLACLYPTFGGVVLRSGYATASMSFLRGQTADAALVLGAGASALTYATVLGLCTALATVRIRMGRRAIGKALASLVALWFGALILQAPARFGYDVLAGFPLRPLGWSEALAVAALVAIAALPDVVISRSGR
jgi:hypothetical protein